MTGIHALSLNPSMHKKLDSTCCISLAEYAVHNEGDTGRQQSIFSSTNTSSLARSITATLAQTALHETVDRQVAAKNVAKKTLMKSLQACSR